jgi:hypothetical protein
MPGRTCYLHNQGRQTPLWETQISRSIVFSVRQEWHLYLSGWSLNVTSHTEECSEIKSVFLYWNSAYTGYKFFATLSALHVTLEQLTAHCIPPITPVAQATWNLHCEHYCYSHDPNILQIVFCQRQECFHVNIFPLKQWPIICKFQWTKETT